MLKISDINHSFVDTKLVTITPIGANTLNINIEAPLVIKHKDLEPYAASNGLNSLTIDYSDAGLFSGPTISYDNKLGTITFSGPADSNANTETLGNTINTDETV
ncbi:hypothetical protein N7280_03490 [Rickettsia rhipicephali]|uniref:hypothetical protein n=1 Tax=Rickettsia rhipicephali TaxID=33992 RepID=UPI0022511F31|nr:hypothetical protein [Rickettsia rhipicephali]MCX4079693.1 hypothetical protein [Rickettsia rhipicephali]